MKKVIIFTLLLGVVLVSCGEKTEKGDALELLSKEIVELEDSLSKLSAMSNAQGKQMNNLVRQQLIEKMKIAYQNYPEAKQAPNYLAKIHLSYSAVGANEMAALYADTLIKKYPDFPDRRIIVESLIHYYMEKKPYDSQKVKDLLLLVLNDKKSDLTKEQLADYQFHLENVELTSEELILKRMELNTENESR